MGRRDCRAGPAQGDAISANGYETIRFLGVGIKAENILDVKAFERRELQLSIADKALSLLPEFEGFDYFQWVGHETRGT